MLLYVVIFPRFSHLMTFCSLSTKELPDAVLILMEYTPSMPVDTAHEYLTKIMDKGAALKRMRETASELLPILGAL